VRGVVFVDDRSAVHVIPRVELRYAEVVSLDEGRRMESHRDWTLKYQLVGSSVVRSIEWKGEGRPETLKSKIDVGEYNKIAAQSVLTILTRGHRDVHLERRSDNIFLVRSGLIEDDARVALCRQFITAMALTAQQTAVPEDARLQILHEIHAAARDLVLPDWYPLKAEDER